MLQPKRQNIESNKKEDSEDLLLLELKLVLVNLV